MAHSPSVSATEAYCTGKGHNLAARHRVTPFGREGFYRRLRSFPGIPPTNFPVGVVPRAFESGGLPCPRSVARKKKLSSCFFCFLEEAPRSPPWPTTSHSDISDLLPPHGYQPYMAIVERPHSDTHPSSPAESHSGGCAAGCPDQSWASIPQPITKRLREGDSGQVRNTGRSGQAACGRGAGKARAGVTSLLPGGPGDWPIRCLRGGVPADNRPGVCTYTPRRSTLPIGSQLIVYREGHGRSPTGSGSGKVDELPLVSQPQSQYTDYAVVGGGGA